MKKFIILLIVCLAVVCFFTSCGEVEKIPVDGTWTVDYAVEKGTTKYEYYTFKLVFSPTQLQIIKEQYEDSARTKLIQNDATETMLYTFGKNSVQSASHRVGLSSDTYVNEVFAMNKDQNTLTWTQGFSGNKYTFTKKSSDTTFVTPSRAYEKYKMASGGIVYRDGSVSKEINNSTLTLYADGKYTLDYANSGSWERSTSMLHPQGLISLTANSTETLVFTTMDLDYLGYANQLDYVAAVSENPGFNIDGDLYFGHSDFWYETFYR